MGRRKIRIQPLPDSQIKAKFKKRKSGLVKKAYELGTLCGAQVALIIFSKDGEEVIDKGYNGTPLEIIERYRSQVHGCRNSSGLPQQQITTIQVPQFQPNLDSRSPMDPLVQQEVVIDPNMQHDQYGMNPQVQHDQYGMNLQVQQDQYGMNPLVQLDQYSMNPLAQQNQFMNSHTQQEVPTDPQMQQDQYVNLHQQQEVPTGPRMQRDRFVNPHRQQDAPTGPRMQQGDQFVNPPHQQQLMTGIPQMQQGLQYSMGANFVDTSSSNYMQDMMEGNQQFHAQFENQCNVRYNNRQP